VQNCDDEERGDEMLELLATESKALLEDINGYASNLSMELNINSMWSYYRYPMGTANAYVPTLTMIAMLVFDCLATDLWGFTMSRRLPEFLKP
jgi:hypothetical protein